MKRIRLTQEQISKVQKIVGRHKSYSSLSTSRVDAFEFSKNIGIKICPYCNINYIYTIYEEEGKPVVRPDIDHFSPKSLFPDLQLNPMNLVPSCLVCNERLKRDIPFCRARYLHPYYDDFDSIMEFKLDFLDFRASDYLDAENFKIIFHKREDAKEDDLKRANRNIDVFKLEERYQQHKDTVINLLSRIRAYNTYKNQEIASLIYGNLKSSISLSLLFPEMNCEINQTSLGKLKRDVLHDYLK